MTQRLKLGASAVVAGALATAAPLSLAQRERPETQTPAPPTAPAPVPVPVPAQVLPATPNQPQPQTQYRDALRMVQTWLDAQQAFERLPALSAGIVVDQQMVWRGAWGQTDHARQLPARSDTIYSICSISKLFTSVAVMQLAEAGKLTLEDDIGKWLPTFTMRRNDVDSGPITLRSLLMHSSGLPREASSNYWMTPNVGFPTREEMLRGLSEQGTFIRASDHYQYSNLGMALLGEVVAAASGTSYEAYVQTQILDPLKLVDTRPTLPAAQWGARMAQGYGALQRDGTRRPLPIFDAAGLTPAAGFSSTVEDLGRFASWQFRLLKKGGREVLRAATLREMQRVQWTDPDGKNTWGLGFGVGRDVNTVVVGHSGVCPGYLSILSMAPAQDVAVIAMTSANDTQGLARLASPVRRLFLKGMRLPVAPANGPPLEAYAGRYGTEPWSSETVVQPWGRDLVVLDMPSRDPANDMALLRHVSGDSFRFVREDGTLGAELTFVRGANGRVTALRQWNQVSLRLEP